MSPRKLSDSDRQEILNLYCTTNETTSTLATRFGVSSSTISRFLKNNLSTSEYEDLIQEKRLARNPNYQSEDNEDDYSDEEENQNQTRQLSLSVDEFEEEDNQDSSVKTPVETSTKIEAKDSQAHLEENNDNQPEVAEITVNPQSISQSSDTEDNEQKDSEFAPQEEENVINSSSTSIISDLADNQAEETEFILEDEKEDEKEYLSTPSMTMTDNEEIYLDEAEDLESVDAIKAMFGEDIDDEDDWEEEDWDEDDEVISEKIVPYIPDEIRVLPLSQAVFPRKCYLAIDRSSELITRPLKDFRDLGKIPQEETQQQTLPIFDNHKVAKRFCDRRGKIIKLPNGNILQKTSSYLHAKGITRLLINGKIYSLL